jgi:hypothetical protein
MPVQGIHDAGEADDLGPGAEEYLSEQINRTLLKKAEEAADRGVELELLRFAA